MSKEQAAAELRARITGSDPELLHVIDGLKAAFGARLKYIRLGDYETGDKRHDVEGIIPATPPDLRNKGESPSAYLRRLEAEHLEAHTQKQAGAAARRSTARGTRR